MALSKIPYLSGLLLAFAFYGTLHTGVTCPGNFGHNSDPLIARSSESITCLGDRPDYDLPIFPNFNPNQLSMQQLCANSTYGGSPRRNAGGYCRASEYNDTHYDPIVNFGTFRPDVYFDLFRPRVFWDCLNRCFCNEGTIDGNQPRYGPRPKLPGISLQSRAIDSAVTTWQGSARQIKIESQRKLQYPSIRSRALSLRTRIAYQSSFVTTDQDNNITCRGDLPSFPLLPPYHVSDFTNLQQLCSVVTNGGHVGANAGGYCHKTNPNTRTVWFSDELTPRYDWTWGGGQFFDVASIRFHCWQRCACTRAPTKDHLTTNLWLWIKNHAITHLHDGSVVDRKQSTGETLQILPPQSHVEGSGSGSNTNQAGTCGADKKQFCLRAWDAAYFDGPPPKAPPGSIESPSAPDEANLTVCGNKCSSKSDCLPSGTDHDCLCAEPSPKDANSLGLDPVFPPTVCLALMPSVIKGLSGRSETRMYLDERGEEYRCACKATFFSTKCCSSTTGLVF